MDGFEWNKIVGGVLAAVLTVTVIGHLGDILVHSKELEKPVVEIATATSGEAAETGGVEMAAGESLIAMLPSADADKGQKAAKKCAACHSFDQGGKNKVGPNLWNIVGAPKGGVAGFAYSDAMAKAGGKWDYDALDKFLAKPKAYIDGTKMAFAGVGKTAQRADLIAYLRSLSASPQPLPEAKPEPESSAAPQPAQPAAKASPAPADQPAQQATAGDSVIAMLPQADVAKGQKAAKKCAACHSFDKGGKNKVGPNLWNIVGAPKGGVAGFAYSDVMAKAGGAWDYEALDKFLAKPKAYMDGTKMAFPGVKKPDQRADLIAYLRSLSDSPKPLP